MTLGFYTHTPSATKQNKYQWSEEIQKEFFHHNTLD